MKADRTRSVIIFVFALTLGAGIATGLLASRLSIAHKTEVAPATGSSWLVQQLDLTPAQSEQMRLIWEGVRDTTDHSTADALKAWEKRDAEIQQLVPTDKLEAYRAANQAYDATVARLKAERERDFQEAVKRTRQMLNPAQVEKYNIILKDRLEGGGGDHQDSAGKAGGGDPAPRASSS